MVLPPGSLEQADPGLEGHGCPLVDKRGVEGSLGFNNVVVCKVKVLDNVLDDDVTGVLSVHQPLILGGIEHPVDPRNGTVLDQFVIIEVCPEKTRNSTVVVAHLLGHSLINVLLEEEVDVPQVAPGPAGLGLVSECTDFHATDRVLRTVVRGRVEGIDSGPTGKCVIETVHVGLQSAF